MLLPCSIQKTIETLCPGHTPLRKRNHALWCVAELMNQMEAQAYVIQFQFEEKQIDLNGKSHSSFFDAYALFYEGEYFDFKGNHTLESIAKSCRDDQFQDHWNAFRVWPQEGKTLSYMLNNDPLILSQHFFKSMLPDAEREYKIWEHTFHKILTQQDYTALDDETPLVPSSRALKSRF